tara:strand:- start:163 stop:417 length:255 start_codon:yes stop_codon:yes gene_type:complete
MTLVTRASFNGQSELQSGKKIMKLKKDVWQNEDGKIAEAPAGEMPKGWAKAKLLGATGQEISDLTAKEWGIGSKAKAPAENKGK